MFEEKIVLSDSIKISDILLKSLLLFLTFFAFVSNRWLWFFFGIFMFIISLVPNLVKKILNINIQGFLILMIDLALIFHLYDCLTDISAFFPIYNKFTHFFSSFIVAYIVFILLMVHYRKQNNISRFKLVFDIIVITVSLGVLWEFLEWGADIHLSMFNQPSLNDTMSDLLADSAAGLLMSGVALIIFKSKKFKKHVHRVAKQIEVLISS
ncbi:MAG: hypothetical protein V5A68_08335 [Candidatus Thermoplasmatota archaeon]